MTSYNLFSRVKKQGMTCWTLSGKRDSNAHNPRSERDALPIEATAR